ncbi:MAG: hypothetical protein WBB76_08490 [Gaiellaceae bacterium]
MTAPYTDTATEKHPTTAELAYRKSGRYEIFLLFDATSRELTVSVLDEVTGVVYDLPVPADDAVEVFHHPFAHAAFRGVRFHDDGNRVRSN